MNEVAQHAQSIYNALDALGEGEPFHTVSVELDKYLEYIGFDQSKTRFEIFGDAIITPTRRSLHITVAYPRKGENRMEFTSHLADDYYPPRDDSEEERFRQAARLLLGIDYAINHCVDKLARQILFSGSTEEHRKAAFNALHALASEAT